MMSHLIAGSYYGLILLYPFLAVFFARLLGHSGGFFQQVKNEVFLWIGYSIIYFAAVLFLGFGAHITPFEAFVFYTIGYWVICYLRKGPIQGSKGSPATDIAHPTS